MTDLLLITAYVIASGPLSIAISQAINWGTHA